MRLVIIGAGGFGREAADVVEASNREDPDRRNRNGDVATYELVGFIDDGTPDPEVLARRGDTHLGTSADLGRWSGAGFLVGVADPGHRHRLAGIAEAAGLVPVTLLAPTCVTGADLRIGEGTIACAHTSITTNISLGRHVHLDRQVTVGHDSAVGDFVTIHPGATISGDVELGAGTRVGSNAVVIQGVSVGEGATIGAGAAVVDDVRAGETVAGVPARRLR